MRRQRRDRGSTLLTTIIVVVVLSALGAAAMVYTGQEAASGKQYQRREMLSSCASAARNWVVSQIRPGAQGANDILNIRGRVDVGAFFIQSGHLDQGLVGGKYPPALELVPGLVPSDFSNTDLTNTVPGGGGIGSVRAYRGIVTCIEKDSTGEPGKYRTETEFVLRLAM